MSLLDAIISPAYAETAAGSGSGLTQLIPLAILFVLMYILLIRPQQKRAKAHKSLLTALKTGDEVVTNGGLVGVIKSVDESFVTIEIANNVIVTVQKQGINQKIPKGSTKVATVPKQGAKKTPKAKDQTKT